MKPTLRFTMILASALTGFAALAPAALAGPGTYYAGPAGGGTSCLEATPCALTKAVEEAVNEDSVVLEPGTYPLAAELVVTKAIDIGGQAGAALPVIETDGHSVRFAVNSKVHVHDLRAEGSGGFNLSSGVAERVFVSFTGNGSEGCSLGPGTSLVDSVCWAHEGGPTAIAAAIDVSSSGSETTVTLRNDTAIATNAAGDAIHTKSTGSGSKLIVEATNVIARAQNHADVEVLSSGGGLPVTEMKLTHSNFATVSGEEAPFATITAPGTNGNQTAPPVFLDAAAGDFREAAGSPTIDAGLTEAADGTLAAGGEARTLAACLGGPAVTDIGAYEFVPTAACASPPSPPPASPASAPTPPATTSPSNHIKVAKVKLNKKKGTATLSVKVPDAGSLTLTGKGAARVKRSSKGAATMSLPVKATGQAKKALARSGKATLHLTLKFVPSGGDLGQSTKTVKLIES